MFFALQNQNQYLCGQDAQEHRQRIYRSIGGGLRLHGCDGVGILQGRRIGGHAGEESADLQVIDLHDACGDRNEYRRHEGDDHTVEHPNVASVRECLHEIGTGGESHATQEEDDAQFLHQCVRAWGHVEIDVEHPTLMAKDQRHDQRTTGQAQFSGGWKSWNGERYASQQDTEEDA